MKQMIDCLCKFTNIKDPCYIVGDLNYPGVDWQSLTAPNDSIQNALLKFVTHNGYVQAVRDTTRKHNTLDIVLTNEPLTLCDVCVASPVGGNDHCQIHFVVATEPTTAAQHSTEGDDCKQQQQLRYDWRETDFTGMSYYLNSVDWHQLLSANFTADSLWTAFANILKAAIVEFMPAKLINARPDLVRVKTYPKRIKSAMARKHCLWRRLKADPNSSTLRDQYSKAESRCRLLIRNYEIRKENDVIKSNNLGKFYRFVNGRLANKQGIGMLKDENGIPVTGVVERAELLNNYFCSVCTQDDGNAPEFKCNKLTENTSIDHVTFNPTNIKRAIARLKPNLASGMDGLPPLLVKKLSSSLLEPLTLLYTSFLSVGRIPDEWRRAVVMSIHKGGQADDVSNYRPIALTCVFSKIMERVVASEISGYMLQHRL
jgi:hypothetical protein